MSSLSRAFAYDNVLIIREQVLESRPVNNAGRMISAHAEQAYSLDSEAMNCISTQP